MQSSTAAAYGVADGRDGFFLSYHPLVQFLFQVQQFLAFALQHPRHWYSRPSAHHFCDVVFSHLLAHHSFSALCVFQLLLNMFDVVFQHFQFAVAYFSHPFVVALTLSPFRFELQVFHLLFVVLNTVYESLFPFPFGAEGFLFVSQFGYVLVELRELAFRRRFLVLVSRLFVFDGFAFYFELLQPSCYLVELFRHRVAFHTQFCGSLVHEVDGLVGQESVGDVSFRQFHGSYAGVVLDTHLVVVFVSFLQTS